jgi:hypothetical protein
MYSHSPPHRTLTTAVLTCDGRRALDAPAAATDIAVVEESIRPHAIADKLRTLRLRLSMGLFSWLSTRDSRPPSYRDLKMAG